MWVLNHCFHLHCWTIQHVNLDTDIYYRGSKKLLALCQENRRQQKINQHTERWKHCQRASSEKAWWDNRRVAGQHCEPQVTICRFSCQKTWLFHGKESKKLLVMGCEFFVCLVGWGFLITRCFCVVLVFWFWCWSVVIVANWFCRDLGTFFDA